MAIKISGNTVIDDSQNISVSGNATANSFVGDGSNLSNLPGGGNVTEVTASGTLADGSKVIVNADGTVSVVGMNETTGSGVGSPTAFYQDTTAYISSTFDSTNNKVVIVYQDGGTSNPSTYAYGKAIVGTVSGTSISFGTPVVFASFDTASFYNSIAYDSTNNKVVIAYRDSANSSYGTAIVGTVSGTSISFGSPVVFNTAIIGTSSAVYDSTNQKIVIAYTDSGNSSAGTAIVGTVSGTSISFGSPVVFASSNTQESSATFDSSNGKVVIAYRDVDNSNYGSVIVGTVSGTSISFGSTVVFNSTDATFNISSTYDSTNQKVVIAHRVGLYTPGYGTAIVGTVSGTSISFGSPAVFEAASTYDISATYDSTNGKIVIAYRDFANSEYGNVIVGTVSGTSISFGSATVFNSANTEYITAVYDSNNDEVVITYRDNGNSRYGTAIVFSTTGYSIPQLGSPDTFSSVRSDYVSSVYDSTNQKIVIAYRDEANSRYGTAIVGTISGTSISFGSPVVYASNGSTEYNTLAYDSTNDKVVIAYRDQGNSSYGTAVVGTVSGTSISFGTPVVFDTDRAMRISATYDSTNQKVVIAYASDGTSNTFYGTAVVGTVSGTSISFGSPVTFHSSYTANTSAVYDSSNQKVVLAYRAGGNSNYGTAIVGTVSGTSISFGSEYAFNSAGTSNISAIFDSTNSKVVIAYTDNGNSDYGHAIVGTVSGTSISFGSETVFESASTSYISAVYDSTNQKVVIAYRDVGNSGYGTFVVGTVSGTSISFDSPTVFESASSYYISTIYDPNNDKVVIVYKDSGNSDYGTFFVYSSRTIETNLTSENYIGISDGAYTNGQTATVQLIGSVDDAQSGLTAGQKYYIQNDGTLSETADDPSVFAGTAVSSTSLVVKS